MQKTAAFASGDHTAGSWVEIPDAQMLGSFKLADLQVRITGNALPCEVGLYVGPLGLASLTAAQRAAGEVYFDAAVVVVADPEPDVHVTGNPIPFYKTAAQSLYTYFKAGNNPTTADFSFNVWPEIS